VTSRHGRKEMRRGITALVPLPKEPEHQLPTYRLPNQTAFVMKLL